MVVMPESVAKTLIRGPSLVASGLSRWKRQVSTTKRVWSYVYVDWYSYYTLDKQLALYEHPQRAPLRCILTLLLMPIPVLSMVLLLEAIPLADPSLGWRRNGAFFLRSFVQRLFMGAAMELQFQADVPELVLSLKQHISVIFLQTTAFVAGHIALSEITGVFPVPFAIIFLIPVFMASNWLPRLYWLRHILRDATQETQSKIYRHKLRGVRMLYAFFFQLVTFYAFFTSLVSQVQAEYQVAMIVILQGLRLVFRRVEWVRVHGLAGRPHSHDLTTVTMATHSHFFNVLFTAACFQTSKSVLTLAVILLWGVYQDVLAFRTIRKQAIRLTSIAPELPGWEDCAPCYRLAHFQRLVTVWRTQAPLSQVIGTSTHPSFHHPIRQLPEDEERHGISITPPMVEWIEGLLQLSHCRELVLVRAYVDLIVPCMYLVVVVAIHTFPNTKYLSYLGTSDLWTLARRMGSQILVRGIVFVWLLRRLSRCDHVTSLHQLDFVLSRQLACFYGGSVMIALGVFGFVVAHNGNDTTFRFDWLRYN